jgi:hypothetical protein
VGTHSGLATSEVIGEPCLYSNVFLIGNHLAKTKKLLLIVVTFRGRFECIGNLTVGRMVKKKAVTRSVKKVHTLQLKWEIRATSQLYHSDCSTQFV